MKSDFSTANPAYINAAHGKEDAIYIDLPANPKILRFDVVPERNPTQGVVKKELSDKQESVVLKPPFTHLIFYLRLACRKSKCPRTCSSSSSVRYFRFGIIAVIIGDSGLVSRYPAASNISSYLTCSALAMDFNSGGDGFLRLPFSSR